jgi:hypothetical protein
LKFRDHFSAVLSDSTLSIKRVRRWPEKRIKCLPEIYDEMQDSIEISTTLSDKL